MKKISHSLPHTIAKIGLAIAIPIGLLTPPVIANTVEDNDIKFKLEGCQHKGQEVVCRLLITNLQSQKRDLAIASSLGRTRIIDVSGNEFLRYQAWLGSDYTGNTGLSMASNTILPGVPIKGGVSFKNVPRSMTKIAVLELEYYGSTIRGGSAVQFNNITIGGGKSTSKLPTESNTNNTASTFVEDKDFRFKLQGCKHKGQEVVCGLLITNLQSQKRILSIANSRIIDISGNEFLRYHAWLGSSYTANTGQSAAQNALLPNIPMQAGVSFRNIPRSVTKIAVLELEHYEGRVQFNNITIGGGRTTSELPTESNTNDTASTSTYSGNKTFLSSDRVLLSYAGKVTHPSFK